MPFGFLRNALWLSALFAYRVACPGGRASIAVDTGRVSHGRWQLSEGLEQSFMPKRSRKVLNETNEHTLIKLRFRRGDGLVGNAVRQGP